MSFNEWKTYKIDEISNVRGGKRVPKGFNLLNNKTKYPYIRLVDIKNNRVNKENLMFLNKETHEKIKRYKVFTGDICLAIVGNTIGLVFYITEEENGFNLTENAVRITEINKETVCCKFLYYYLFSNLGQEQILSNKVGSAQGKLPIKNIRNIEVRFPPLKEQKAISKILSDLDEKIEVNNKINKNLEEMAQTIFKQWFVDFEFPNEEGKPYKSSGGEMIKSELGMIPKGWKVELLKNYCELNKGLSYKGKFLAEQGVPMLNLGNVKPGGGYRKEKNKYYTGEFKERHTVKKGDIIIANTDMTQDRTILGSPFIVPDLNNSESIIFTHHLFAFSNLKISKKYIYYYLKSKKFRERAESYATGTTVLAISKNSVLDIDFVLPTNSILKKFDLIVESFIQKIESTSKENDLLEKLRDTLLPKLMSGEIRVPLENNEN